jgi:peroxiredoxin Q/BCP
MTVLNENDNAIEFALNSCKEGEISLANIKEDFVILYFYPKDDTPGCTIEANEFSSLKQEFDSFSVKILGISKDDLISHNKFIKKYNLEIDLLEDSKNIAESYGVWVEKNMYGKKYMGIERTSFLIDKNRKIAKIWKKVKPEGHAKDVLEYIKSIS